MAASSVAATTYCFWEWNPYPEGFCDLMSAFDDFAVGGADVVSPASPTIPESSVPESRRGVPTVVCLWLSAIIVCANLQECVFHCKKEKGWWDDRFDAIPQNTSKMKCRGWSRDGSSQCIGDTVIWKAWELKTIGLCDQNLLVCQAKWKKIKTRQWCFGWDSGSSAVIVVPCGTCSQKSCECMVMSTKTDFCTTCCKSEKIWVFLSAKTAAKNI